MNKQQKRAVLSYMESIARDPKVEDFEVMKSPFDESLYIKELQVHQDSEGQTFNELAYHQITLSGSINKDVGSKFHFDSLADRVHFFGSLKPYSIK